MKRNKLKTNPFIQGSGGYSNKYLSSLSPRKSYDLGVLDGKKILFEYVLKDNPTQSELEDSLLLLNSLLEKIKTINISALSNLKAYDLGRGIGNIKAIKFVLNNNFDKDLIQNEWFNVSNQSENFE